jgi:sortase A
MAVRTIRAWLVTAVAVAGLAFLAGGLWIPAKAALAQVLLERAWQRSAESGGSAQFRAWSWADAVPLARLSFGGRNFIVLSGGSGEALAFGPAHVPGSALPGGPGLSLIAGHRDTHFSGLRDLAPGAMVSLETPDGAITRYRVSGAQVVHRDNAAFPRGGGERLALVTCFPFDTPNPNGPLRFIVFAQRL